jgi:hypothetical protein
MRPERLANQEDVAGVVLCQKNMKAVHSFAAPLNATKNAAP